MSSFYLGIRENDGDFELVKVTGNRLIFYGGRYVNLCLFTSKQMECVNVISYLRDQSS